MLAVFQYNINNISRDKLKDRTAVLSREEIGRADKFRFDKDYKLYTAGKIMARKIIADKFRVRPEEIKFRIDKYGRPFLEYPQISNFDFNISHSGDYVVLAVSDKRAGIDIEKIKPIDLKIAETCFHDREIEHLHHNKNKSLENFFRIWTLKESFIKAVGQGLSYPLKNFYFTSLTGDAGIRIECGENHAAWSFREYDIPGYKLAVCANSEVIAAGLQPENYEIN